MAVQQDHHASTKFFPIKEELKEYLRAIFGILGNITSSTHWANRDHNHKDRLRGVAAAENS